MAAWQQQGTLPARSSARDVRRGRGHTLRAGPPCPAQAQSTSPAASGTTRRCRSLCSRGSQVRGAGCCRHRRHGPPPLPPPPRRPVAPPPPPPFPRRHASAARGGALHVQPAARAAVRDAAGAVPGGGGAGRHAACVGTARRVAGLLPARVQRTGPGGGRSDRRRVACGTAGRRTHTVCLNVDVFPTATPGSSFTRALTDGATAAGASRVCDASDRLGAQLGLLRVWGSVNDRE